MLLFHEIRAFPYLNARTYKASVNLWFLISFWPSLPQSLFSYFVKIDEVFPVLLQE